MPIADDIEKLQSILCHAVLSAELMKPSTLKRHLEMKHPEHAKKDLDLFKRDEGCRHNGGLIFDWKMMKLAPQAKGIHCIIHRYALTSKTLPASAGSASICNQNGKLCEHSSTRLFKDLCK